MPIFTEEPITVAPDAPKPVRARASSLTSLTAYRRKQRFLEAFRTIGTLMATCRQVKVSRQLVAEWERVDEVFAQDYADAKAYVVDSMEATLIHRAKEKSDALLLAFLRGHRPEIYGNPNGLRGPDVHIDQRQQVSLQSNEINVQALGDQDLDTLHATLSTLLEKAKAAAALGAKPTLQLERR